MAYLSFFTTWNFILFLPYQVVSYDQEYSLLFSLKFNLLDKETISMAKSLVVATLMWLASAHPHEPRGTAKLPSPLKIIDDSIEALGGQNALRGLKGVIYESAEYVFATYFLI